MPKCKKRCPALTASGSQCSRRIPDDLPACLHHDPARREELIARCGKGGSATKRKNVLKLFTEKRIREIENRTSLRSTDELLGELELSLYAIRHAGLGPEMAAELTVRIVRCAHQILGSAVIEKENEELRRILVEKHPDLRARVRAL